MSGRIIFDGIGPRSQPIDAVKSMIEFFDGEPCQKLPAKVRLANGWQLTRSSQGDCYYTTSREACSCLGFYYKRTCRHVKALACQMEKEQDLSPTQIFARDIVASMES